MIQRAIIRIVREEQAQWNKNQAVATAAQQQQQQHQCLISSIDFTFD